MIGDIRRKLRQTDASSWDVNLALQAEESVISERFDAALVLNRPPKEYPFRNPTAREYYTNLVRSAIAGGGWYGNTQISIPWLRMTLAGLESKRFDPEMMWNGMEEDAPPQPNVSETLSYEALFPSTKHALKGS